MNRFAMARLVVFLVIGAVTAGSCERSRPRPARSHVLSPSTSPVGELLSATILVEGMSCGSCVARIKRHLKAMDGVSDVSVSLERRNATVRYDKDKVSPAALVAAINDLGYQASAATVSPAGGDR